MQTQQLSPYSEASAPADQHQQVVPTRPELTSFPGEQDDHAHKKKSVIGKVKDKAKKLKRKIQKPKTHDGAGDDNEGSSSASSGDDESDNESHLQEMTPQTGENTDEKGLKGESFEAIPDTSVGGVDGVHRGFENLQLSDDREDEKLQNEVPSAPGQVSAGVSPYLGRHDPADSSAARVSNPSDPVEEGKNVEGKDLIVAPGQEHSAGDLQQEEHYSGDLQQEVNRAPGPNLSDNSGAWYTPTSSEGVPGDVQSDRANADLYAKSYEKKPSTITSRVVETVTGLKDTVSAKMGYGAPNKSSDSSPKNTTSVDTPNAEDKSLLQKIQESAASASEAVASKLSYGSKQSPVESSGQDPPSGASKSYSEKASEAVLSAKDAVAAKFGYGKSSEEDHPVPASHDKTVTDQVSEGFQGAKDVVASKLGHGDNSEQVSETQSSENKSYTQKMSEMIHGAKDTVVTKLGYGESQTDPAVGKDGSKTALQKIQETARGASEAVTSKLGYGKRADTDDGVSGNESNATPTRFHPGEEDVALSQLITEKLSTGASTVKGTILKPFNKTGPSPSSEAHEVAGKANEDVQAAGNDI
ncbi:hypothetical protein KP509_26G026600 [Ceratopteris richardii]|uniref:Low-temperature-induced 65 kDa protein n=1 Tax=Ceratopteris richardii TaxID=49495 RepID=A0A8T2RJ38_CERRI|nr:hypothetical protein KP509_26G026600 [Ceratopteris richardii]